MARIVSKYDIIAVPVVDDESRLVGVMNHFVGNNEEAEDLAQEVFMRVWRGRKSYPAKSKFSTWLFTNALTVYKFHVDWNSISLSTFTGPDIPIAATGWPNQTVPNALSQGGNDGSTGLGYDVGGADFQIESTADVDWGPWSRKVMSLVKSNWYSIMPVSS